MGQDVVKQILALLNNNRTSVKEISDIKANYYNFITDTIYLATDIYNSKEKRLDKTNLFCGKLVTICHECIHSIQSRTLHILNLTLSNLSIVLTVIAIVLLFVSVKPLWYTMVASIIIVMAIAVRLVLEVDAINKSLDLAEKVATDLKATGVEKADIISARKIVKKLMPGQIIKMVLDKIIMLVILVI